MRTNATWRWLALNLLWIAACGPKPAAKVADAPAVGPQRQADPLPELGAEPSLPAGALHGDWLSQVHTSFHDRWSGSFLEQARTLLPGSHPLNNMTLEVTVVAVLSEGGKVERVEVVRSSGNPEFDQAASLVVTDSSPLPKPPESARSDDGFVYLTWRFARDGRQDSPAGATLERREWELARAIPALVARGQSLDALNRVAAVAPVSQPSEPGAPADLDPGLAQPRDLVGLARIAFLGVIREVAAQRGGEQTVRLLAMRTLGELQDSASAAVAQAVLGSENDVEMRVAAAQQLGAAQSELLLSLIRQFDGPVSASAAKALAAAGGTNQVWELAKPALSEKSSERRRAVLETLIAVGADESAATLAAAASPATTDRAERRAAVRALGAVAAGRGPGAAVAAKTLYATLGDGDASIRAAAVDGLAEAGRRGLRSRGAFYKIFPLVTDKDPLVRAAAIEAIGSVEPKLAENELPVIARREKQTTTQIACARALAGSTTPESVVVLKRLASGSPDVAVVALNSLRARGDAEARKALASFADRSEPELRAIALSATTDEATLSAALDDASPEVQAGALSGLVALRGAGGVIAIAASKVTAAQGARERVLFAHAWLRGAK